MNNLILLCAMIAFVAGCDNAGYGSDLAEAETDEYLSAGDATSFDATRNAFGKPIRGISFENLVRFEAGDSLFNRPWVTAPASTTARDGLGPLFNARSCAGCHTKDGRGRPPLEGEEMVSMLLRLSIPGKGEHGEPVPDPIYGGQLNGRAILGHSGEGKGVVSYREISGEFADGEKYSLRQPTYAIEDLQYGPLHDEVMVSPRVAPAIIGLGLLELIPEENILDAADPEDEDGDGISGRPNYVWDREQGQKALGRFGWKANQPSLLQQVAGAFVGDMSITSDLFRRENYTAEQRACRKAPNGGDPEIGRFDLDIVAFYTQTLAVPARRNWKDKEVLRGKRLFTRGRCHRCHTPTWQTGIKKGFPQMSRQKIHPYSDLLLHDMGQGLADDRPDFEATGSEWRTPPLWGIGLVEKVSGHTFFLHDGRARDLVEAILWHGGEAEWSQRYFIELSKRDRDALIAFLRSL